MVIEIINFRNIIGAISLKKMNIQRHVEGHAKFIVNKKKRKLDVNNTINFVASIDVAQFIMQGYEVQEQIDNVMSTILETIIASKHEFQFRNGIQRNKNGTEKQKYRKSNVDLTHTVSAYHNISVNGYTSVEPHLHILFEKNEYYFSTLQSILQITASKYNLVFNFAEATRIDHNFSDSEQLVAKRLSWMIQITDDNAFIKLIYSNQFDKSLNFFMEYTETRDLISMRIKTMEYMKYRLNQLNLNKEIIFDNRTYNLKESYPISMRDPDYQLLKKITKGDITEEKFRRDSILAREYMKSCYGFKSELIDVLKLVGYVFAKYDGVEIKNRFERAVKIKVKYSENSEQHENLYENIHTKHIKTAGAFHIIEIKHDQLFELNNDDVFESINNSIR